MLRWELNWSSLYYVSELVLVLSICAGGLYVGLMALLIGVGENCSRYDNRLTRWLNKRHVTPRVRRHVNRLLPSTTLLVVGYILGAAGIFSPIRELHNVEVTDKIAPRVYGVMVNDQPQVWRVCEDGDDLPLKAGMVMKVVQYEQGSDCVRFTARTNVMYLRDEHHNVVDRQGRKLFGGD